MSPVIKRKKSFETDPQMSTIRGTLKLIDINDIFNINIIDIR